MSVDSKMNKVEAVMGIVWGQILQLVKRLRDFIHGLGEKLALGERLASLTSLFLDFKVKVANMIGGLEKKFSVSGVRQVPEEMYEGVDLGKLSSYVAYKASSVKSKFTIELVLVLSVVLNIFQASTNFDLMASLRRLPYMLVPNNIQQVTKAVPQQVPDSYAMGAFSGFLSLLGNINDVNISEHYKILQSDMTESFGIQFENEMRDFIGKVEEENLSEFIKIVTKEVVSDGTGNYKGTAIIKVQGFLNGVPIDPREEIVTIEMGLTTPKPGKNWAFKISDISRVSTDTFRSSRRLQRGEK